MKLNKPVNIESQIAHICRIVSLCIGLIAFSTLMYGQESRTITGEGNNTDNPEWGAAGDWMFRKADVNYLDGISQINDINKPNPRVVSNQIFDQTIKINDSQNHSDYVWAFGQFLDHDLTLVENAPWEPLFIDIPLDDQFLPPGGSIFMFRNLAAEGTGFMPGSPREYVNEITSFLDGSAVYGSDQERADWLRTNNGDGKLKVSEGDLLPWNTFTGMRNDDVDPSAPFMADDTHSQTYLFVAGDVRANENPLLTAIHTVFVREHNRLCDHYASENPNWTGEQLYQKARKMIGAYLQAITYEEWLPSIDVIIPEYTGYIADMDPAILNSFSAAAFRMGHTLINGEIIRMDNDGNIINLGNISLKDAFFAPSEVLYAGGIEPYLKGMATQVQQEMDAKVIDEVRNFLFADGPNGGLDLAAININRGRERGLPDYNTMRDNFGLTKMSSFNDLTESAEEAQILEDLYGDINNLDAWVGMLAEKHLPGTMFGELVTAIMQEQFQILRMGDRFYYENDPGLSNSEKDQIKATRLQDIIMRNCKIDVMQKDVFLAMPHGDIPTGPVLANVHLEASIFPNPVSSNSELKIISQKEELASVTIYDAFGRVMYQVSDVLNIGENYLNISFDNNEWASGFYTIVIESDLEFNTLKFIKE